MKIRKYYPFMALFFALMVQNTTKAQSSTKIHFVVLGDAGTGAKGQYDVAKAMEKKCKKDGCDFALMLGDNIYNRGVTSPYDKQFETKFEEPYKNLDFDFYLTLGNHDYRGNVQAQIDYSKISKKWKMPSNIYSFNKDIIDFFSIDTNKPSKAQAERVKKEVEASKAKWKIVFGHHPRYSNGVYTDSVGVLREMQDQILCNKATLYLSGHEHNKQHLAKACGVEYMVMGSGAGTRDKIKIAKNTLFAKANLGFAWFEVDNDSIKFQILDTASNVEYEYVIK